MSKQDFYERDREKLRIKEKLIREEFFPALAALCTKYHVSICQTVIYETVDGCECEKIESFTDHEWYIYSKERTVAFADGI